MNIASTTSKILKSIGIKTQQFADQLYISKHECIKRAYLLEEERRGLRYVYPLDEQSVVIDVGGYQGQWASDIFGRYRSTVHVFEPVLHFADSMKARFAKNPSIHIHPFGLAKTSRQDMISLLADGSSLFRKGVQRSIQLKRATDTFTDLGLKRIDLLKTNIEGGEYELLENLIESGYISHIVDLQIQFHDIQTDSKKRMGVIQSRLAQTHTPTYQYEFIWENWHRKS